MIYFDNAATTYPKPRSVVKSLSEAADSFGGNPGRSGHTLSLRTAEMVYGVRKKAAEFFDLEPERVIFTLNCTHALNLAIKGALRPGDHVVTSCLEHNSVLRPLHTLEKRGVEYTVVSPGAGDAATLQAFAAAVKPGTAAIVCTHGSNLTGKILPVEKIAVLCKERGLLLIVDAAQSAGLLPLSVDKLGRCVVCTAGHKGLYGVSGTGMMLLGKGVTLSTLTEGGTGSVSANLDQPDFLPDRFESGTVNTIGICSLGKGLDFVKGRGLSRIYRHEMGICLQLFRALEANKNLRVLDPSFGVGTHLPVLSFVHKRLDCGEVGARFDRAGIAVRSGLHCAPLAHRFYGTEKTGAVRLSPGAFTGKAETEALLKEIKKM